MMVASTHYDEAVKTTPIPWERLFLRCVPGRKEFFVVEIYASEKAMHKAIKRADGKRIDPKVVACVCTYKATSLRGLRTGELGTIFLHRGALFPSLLAHEMGHAALRWAEHWRLKISQRNRSHYSRDAEERTMQVLAYLLRQFYEKQPKRVFFIAGGKVTFEDAK